MAFSNFGFTQPFGAPVERHEILANSITVTVLDSVKAVSGFATLGTAGVLVLGHVTAIETNKGVGLNTTGAAGAEIGSFINTFLTASDNQTVANVRAVIDISKYTLYADTPNATIGTTTGSNLLGYHADLVSEDTIDESSAITGTAQYTIWGLNPGNSAQGVYSVYESVVYGV